MSIDWRVNLRPVRFVVRQLLDGTRAALAKLLGREDFTLDIHEHNAASVNGWERGEIPAPSTEAFLEQRCRGECPWFVVSVRENRDFAALVEFMTYEDDEAGTLIEREEAVHATPWWRLDASYVVSIAVAIAAAQLTTNPVMDDPPRLGGDLERSPNDLLDALSVTGASSLTEAATAVIARTRMHG